MESPTGWRKGLDHVRQRAADFRKQRDKLREENSAFGLKNVPKRRRLFSREHYKYNRSIIVPAIVILLLAPLVSWLILGQQRETTRAILNGVPGPRVSETLAGPEADQLEQRVASLNDNMQNLSGLLADVESKLTTTDELEERITGLTENLEALNSLTGELESRQVDADTLAARISTLSEDVQKLGGMTTDLESRQAAAEKLEARITGMSDSMAALDKLAAGLESRQQAADKLEAQLARITGSMKALDTLAENLESRQESADSLEAQVAELSRGLTAANNLTADLKSSEATTEQLEARVAKVRKELALLLDVSAGLKSGKVGLASGDFLPGPADSADTSAMAAPTTATEQPLVAARAKTKAEPGPMTQEAPSEQEGEQDRGLAVEALYKQSRQDRPWKINLISSPSREDAMQFASRAMSKGVETQLQEVSVRGAPYWRVQIVGFASYDEALAHSESVKAALGVKETWIFKP
jgi:uncharacterized protein YlxW (UPF0749 family)